MRNRHPYCACLFCTTAAVVMAMLIFRISSPVNAADKPISFIEDVAPIIKEHCLACHEPKKKSGKYDMATFEKLMEGGANGEMIIPGKPEESEFYTLIVTDEPRRMPPRDKGEAVSTDKAEIIRRWILQGAKLDSGIDPKADLVKELRKRWKPPVPPQTYKFPVIINALAFTPDSKQLVVGGHHELTIWSATDGKLLKRLRTRAERAYAVAFLRDGKLAVAGGRPGQEGDVRIYDLTAKPMAVDNGVEILDGVGNPQVMVAQLLDADDSVLCLAISADGKKLAAGGCDRAVRIWNLSDGPAKAALEQTIENHADWVLGVQFSQDGKYLISAARDKTAKVWDLTAKESVMTFPDHQNIVYSVTVSQDGSTGISVGADKQLRTWKIGGDGKQLKAAGGHGDEVFKVVHSPTAPILATSSADKTVRLWDLQKLSVTKTLAGMSDFVYAVTFSPDGSMVAAGAYNGEVRIWNVNDGSERLAFNASPGYRVSSVTTNSKP